MPILRPIKLGGRNPEHQFLTDVVGRANTGLLTPMVVLNPIIRASFNHLPHC